MWWAALLPSGPSYDGARSPIEPARPLALWALRFTPRVALADESVVMEVGASLRLFGGARRLATLVGEEAAQMDVHRIGWAPTSLAALALARAGRAWSAGCLASLPLSCLSAARPHEAALARIGCKSLGDLSQLPRAGVARRFGQAVLDALDCLHGRLPERHAWVTAPECFDMRLELMQRVETAAALLFGAQRLLLQMSGWLAARQAGIRAFTLHWAHDAMRSRGTEDGGQLTVRMAEPTRHVGHLCRLLSEHLAHVRLAAPVGELRLVADEAVPLPASHASWLPDEADMGDSLNQVLERISARLGPGRVLRPELREDHRPERMCLWRDALVPGPAGMRSSWLPWPCMPQPAFLRPRPLRLQVQGERPFYHGELHLLLGPQRLEAGWWDEGDTPREERAAFRDYWVAFSGQAGLLWVFRTRSADRPAWFLHGYFA